MDHRCMWTWTLLLKKLKIIFIVTKFPPSIHHQSQFQLFFAFIHSKAFWHFDSIAEITVEEKNCRRYFFVRCFASILQDMEIIRNVKKFSPTSLSASLMIGNFLKLQAIEAEFIVCIWWRLKKIYLTFLITFYEKRRKMIFWH